MMKNTMVNWPVFIVIGMSWVLFGCSTAQQPKQQTYAESVLNRPVPQDEPSRARECGMIKSEMQKQMGAMSYASSPAVPPQQRGIYLSETHQNIAALESRALKIRCAAPYNNPPAATPGAPQ